MNFSKLGFTIFCLLFFFWTPMVSSQPKVIIEDIISVKDPQKQLELALQLPVSFGKDTLQLQQQLGSLWKFADETNNIPVKWAYYMLMADGYSIAFDQVNERSDFYFKKASNLLIKGNYAALKITGLIREGYYHFTYREVKEAFPFFLQANEMKSKVDLEKIPLLPLHFGFIGNFYSYIGNQDQAIRYLQAALPFTEKLSRKRIDMVNAIAVYKERDSLLDDAYHYYKQALHIAKLAKDSVWIGIISGNISEQELRKGNLEQAIVLVKQNIALSTKFNEYLDAMRANLSLASIYILQGKWVLAQDAVWASQQLMEDKPYFLPFRMKSYKYLAEIAAGMHKQADELQYLNKYVYLRDSLAKKENNAALQKIYWQWETEKFNLALKEEQDKRDQIKQVYQFVGMLLIFGFIIVVLLIHRSKSKIIIRSTMLEKEQLRLSYEKQLVDHELVILKNSLEEFTATIKQNDLTIHQLRTEISEVDQNPEYQQQISSNLNELLESHIMTDERWIRFKHVFERVYPDYLAQKKQANPKLSENDLRLLALLKLDLSNRSMSDLLGVSIEGVKKAKQRLKKKLDGTLEIMVN
ncbi:tetratricopeptide repeat protein [Sphingobacterium sp. HJSM2_6]|uniref:tetratricopeptide repeat protein n=1 Tax=Sphingobacterium sp. HJSM2_6 TaxID=3366264 RepID=UPI003BE8C6F1